MSVPLPFRKQRGSGTRRDAARQDWIDDRLREARIVVADMTGLQATADGKTSFQTDFFSSLLGKAARTR